RRIAFALEAEAFDQADRQVGDLGDQRTQLLARQLDDAAIAGGDARPLMHAGVEHLRPADEIADMPVGKRDLAPKRGSVEYAETAALDQPDAVMLGALAEQGLPAIEHLAPSLLQDHFPLAQGELFHQRRGAADQLLILGEKQRGAGSGFQRRGSASAPRIYR